MSHIIKKYSLKLRRLYKLLKHEYVIDNYTIADLSHSKELNICDELSSKEINNFIFIESETLISFNKTKEIHNEREYLNNLKEIFKILNKHNKQYTIKINISNRRLLKESNLLSYTNNIDLIISNCNYDYTIKEYLEEESRIDKLIEPIKNSNLSPFEKYLAIYNLVKQFKKYNENSSNKKESRLLKYILDNEYIVCVGFSDLLTVLLDKVGIPVINAVIAIDDSYKSGFTMDCIPTKLTAHQRNIVKIDDDKYNIHGIYIADATWDNNMTMDLYHNAAITFDRKKEAKDLEKITDIDIILDFHDIKEFNEKINFILNRQIKKSTAKKYPVRLMYAYKSVYLKIMQVLIKLDYLKYKELYSKYHHKIEVLKKQESINSKEIDNLFSLFLTEYYHYIINLSNKSINEYTLYQALREIKTKINGYSVEELNIWEQKTRKNNQQTELNHYPYIYNPKETRLNYLSDAREKKRTKSITI